MDRERPGPRALGAAAQGETGDVAYAVAHRISYRSALCGIDDRGAFTTGCSLLADRDRFARLSMRAEGWSDTNKHHPRLDIQTIHLQKVKRHKWHE